jgi:hypothetical protein
MAGGLAIGNSTLLVLLKKSLLYLRRPPTPLAAGPEHQDGPASPAFYAKALTGYGAGLLFQACASQLPAGVSSVYNVVIRIGGAFVTVLVNPLLPRFVTTDRTNYTAVGKLTGTGFAISFALTITLRFTHLGSWSETAVLGAIWIGCATCNAALSRVGYRELPVAFWWIPSALVAVVGAGTFLLVANDSSALWLASGVLLVELGSALITAAALRIIDLLFLIVSAVLAGADMAGTPAAGLTVCALGGLIAVVLAILISSSAARQGRASLYTPKVRPGRHRGEKGGRQDDAPLVARPRPGVLETPAASEEVWIKQPVAFPATMPISYRRRTGNE